MDNKIINRVRAFAQKAIPRTLLCMFILIFSMSSSVFAVTGEEMSIEIAQDLLDFMKENLVIYASHMSPPNTESALNTLNKYTAEQLSNSFNSSFYNMLKNYTELENNILLENITCYFSCSVDTISLYFVVSNNSSPNGNPLAFQMLQENSSNVEQFNIKSYGESTEYIYGTFLNIQSNRTLLAGFK